MAFTLDESLAVVQLGLTRTQQLVLIDIFQTQQSGTSIAKSWHVGISSEGEDMKTLLHVAAHHGSVLFTTLPVGAQEAYDPDLLEGLIRR